MSRTIPLGRRSLTGGLQCRGGLVSTELRYESRLERDAFMLLQLDNRVDQLCAQPFTIEYQISGKPRRYTPDIQATWWRPSASPFGRKVMIFEVKPHHVLQRNETAFVEKIDAIQGYVEARGWGFQILTEKEIRIPRLQNTEALIPYWAATPEESVTRGILSLLQEKKSLKFAEIDRAVSNQLSSGFGVTASALKYLIIHRRVVVDLDHPIGPDTDVRCLLHEHRRAVRGRIQIRQPGDGAGSVWSH